MGTLEDAIYLEKLQEIKRILEDEPSLIDSKDKDGVSMALLAAKTGNLKIIRYIVEYSRANMNIHDDQHRSMLHYAAMSGNVESCQYLVERVGLSPLEGDVNLVTPIDIAYSNRFLNLREYFEKEIGTSYNNLYRNPIRTGFYPDPSIVRVDEDYYMVNSSFIYFPCIPVSHSKDLVHWHTIGYAITNPEWAALDELEGGRGYWAPDISYYEGKFYITATYRMNDDGNVYRKQIIVSSENPEGPYSKPSIIDEDGIDPSIFTDDDGKRYMLLNRGARILPLDKDATKQIGEATLLYYGDNKRAPEGPHLLKKDGFYYLFEAEGGTGPGHRITVSRSRELFGRYEPCPYNPIMRQTDETAIIQRCGHGKPVMTQTGQWYMVYLCGRKIGEGYSLLGRETALDPITWTADGWPIVNNLDGPSTLQIKPDLPETIWEESLDDDFKEKYLGTDWLFPRSPQMDGIDIKLSWLKMKGSRFDLDSMYARNILLRRQTSFKFQIECKMKMPHIYPGQDAGVTCYYDENTFLKFGLFATQEESPRLLVGVREYVDGYRDGNFVEINPKEKYIYFKIEVNNLQRVFYVSFDGEKYTKIEVLSNVYYLCDEGLKKGKRFTGAMIGMYAYAGDFAHEYARTHGVRIDENMYVEFDYFNYKPLQ